MGSVADRVIREHGNAVVEEDRLWFEGCINRVERETLAELEPRIAALVAAGDALYDAVVWMSGSASFGPEGEAHEGWVAYRDKIAEARAVFEQAAPVSA